MDSYRFISETIKKHLKGQKISQKKLAKMMSVPESTVKKWLNSEDGSFNRLNRVCESLGLSLSNVLRSAERQETQIHRFSDAHQKFFLANPIAFAIYWLAVYERVPVQKIAKDLHLKDDVLKRWLIQLDRLDLLELMPKDHLRLPKIRPIRWVPDGIFIERIFREWSMNILSECLTNKDNIILQCFQLTEASSEEFYTALKKLEDRFARRTVEELSVDKLATQKIRFLACTGRGSFLK